MSFASLLPLWSLILLALAVGAVVLWCYRRPSGPLVLRLLVLVLLILVAANPVRHEVVPARDPARVILVLDHSRSMAVADATTAEAGELQTRFAVARTALGVLGERLSASNSVERWALGQSLRQGWSDPVDPQTTFAGLGALLDEDRPPAAVVVASDGVDRSRLRPDRAFAAAGVPVFTLGCGQAVNTPNVALRLEATSPTAFVGQQVMLRCAVEVDQALHGRQGELVVRDARGEEVLRRVLRLGEEPVITFQQDAGEQAGEIWWEATMSTLESEATEADNRAAVVVQVVDRPLKVIVIEGQPYWDASFAVRAWRRDRQLQVQTVYRLGRELYRSGDRKAPRLEQLFADPASVDLDLVVLGLGVDRMLEPAVQDGLLEWVEQGGALLLLGSHRGYRGVLAGSDPLLRRDGSHPLRQIAVTAAGRGFGLLPEGVQLPAVEVGKVTALKERARILIGDDTSPLVVARRHGGGNVVALNGTGFWRWSFGTGDTAATAAGFWRQLAKSVIRDRHAGLQADRARYRVGQQAVIATDDEAPVVVAGPGVLERQVIPAEGAIRIEIEAPGRWTFSQGAQRISIVAEPDVREVVVVARDDARLQVLAEATGGRSFDSTEADQLVRLLEQRNDLLIDEPRQIPLVTSAWWFMLAVGLLVGEWWWRRRGHGAL